MNALAHPALAGAAHAEGPIDTRDPVEVNCNWELDRALMLQRSERRGWIVGGVGILVAFISALALLAWKLGLRKSKPAE